MKSSSFNAHNLQVSPHSLKVDISAEYIICQLLLASILFKVLTFSSILELTVTSTNISKITRSLMDSNWRFCFSNHRVHLRIRRFSYYTPKHLHLDYINQHPETTVFQLYPNVTQLTMGSSFNIKLKFGKMQHLQFYTNLKRLTFGESYDQPICSLPPNLTHLNFGLNFNRLVDNSNLPQKLTHLFFDCYYNQPITTLPLSLTNLTFGNLFDRPLQTPLPPNIKILEFGYFFNNFLDSNNLPKNLTHLKVGCEFDQPIDDLPKTITHLHLGFKFNRSVDHLPPNLQHLILGYFFSKSLQALPPTITYLLLGHHYPKPVSLPQCKKLLMIYFD